MASTDGEAVSSLLLLFSHCCHWKALQQQSVAVMRMISFSAHSIPEMLHTGSDSHPRCMGIVSYDWLWN